MGTQAVRLPEMWCRQITGAGTENLCLGIRPEHLTFTYTWEENTLCAAVKYEEDYGNRFGIYLDVEGTELIALCEDEVPQCGQTVYLKLNPEKIHLFRKEDSTSIGYPAEIPMGKSIRMEE